MHGEMPGFFPGRPGGEHHEPLLDMILERRPIPPGAPPEIHGLARMLAAVAGPAEPGELAGQDAALAAFARMVPKAGTSPAAPRSARRSLPEWPARVRLPLAAVLTAVAAGLGSTVAAYAGVLPGPIQHFAHVTIGAPDSPRDFPRPVPVAASSPARAHHQRATARPRKTRAAASVTPVPSTVSHPPRHFGLPGDSPGPARASCLPTPSPTQNQGQGRPSPAPGGPSLVPVIVNPAQLPGRSGPTQNPASPGPAVTGWPALSPAATACPSEPAPPSRAR